MPSTPGQLGQDRADATTFPPRPVLDGQQDIVVKTERCAHARDADASQPPSPPPGALGQQTAGRFDRLEHGMRTGFAEMRGKLDQTAARQQQIVDLLTTFISERDGQ